jgi:hypothetical protein
MTLDPTLLQTASLLGYLLVFLGGVVTSIGPCNIATIPLIVGYVGGSTNLSRPRSFALSLAFAVGLAITFMLLGIFASLIGGWSAVLRFGTTWWRPPVPDEQIALSVDVSPVWEAKQSAMRCHATQWCSSPLAATPEERHRFFFEREYFVRAASRDTRADFLPAMLQEHLL